MYSEPCSTENAISYKRFCFLGGLANPRLSKILRQNGTHTYFTYHLARY